jgi:hypothetical protein
MKSHFLEIPLFLIHEDKQHPNRDTRHVFEHMRHMFSHPRQFPLPAIDVRLINEKLVVVRGHNYLRIARELGDGWVRAVFESEWKDPAEALKRLPSGIRVTPNEVFERELAIQVLREFHVYFFEHPLSLEAQKRFLADIAGFFERLETPLIARSEKRLFQWAFPFEGRCAEFEALVPTGDQSWMAGYLKICKAFSRNVQRIVSFQGARFPG